MLDLCKPVLTALVQVVRKNELLVRLEELETLWRSGGVSAGAWRRALRALYLVDFFKYLGNRLNLKRRLQALHTGACKRMWKLGGPCSKKLRTSCEGTTSWALSWESSSCPTSLRRASGQGCKKALPSSTEQLRDSLRRWLENPRIGLVTLHDITLAVRRSMMIP